MKVVSIPSTLVLNLFCGSV